MEIEEEDLDKDEGKKIDTSLHVEEDEEYQLTSMVSTMVPTNDVATEDTSITIVLIVNDDENGEPQVEVNMQQSKPDTSLTSLMDTYSEESQQQKGKS